MHSAPATNPVHEPVDVVIHTTNATVCTRESTLRGMKPALLVVPVLAATLLLAAGQGDKAAAARAVAALTVVEPGPPGRYCVDFTPYVTGFAPGGGPEPSPALVGQLLHELLADGRVKCIFTYGSFGAYGFVPSILRSRAAATGVRTPIIMNLWLDVDAAANSAQIGAGIALARAFPDIIVAVSCGSEIRLRHNRAVAVPIILDCLARLRAAGIPQPLTHQATWVRTAATTANALLPSPPLT